MKNLISKSFGECNHGLNFVRQTREKNKLLQLHLAKILSVPKRPDASIKDVMIHEKHELYVFFEKCGKNNFSKQKFSCPKNFRATPSCMQLNNVFLACFRTFPGSQETCRCKTLIGEARVFQKTFLFQQISAEIVLLFAVSNNKKTTDVILWHWNRKLLLHKRRIIQWFQLDGLQKKELSKNFYFWLKNSIFGSFFGSRNNFAIFDYHWE